MRVNCKVCSKTLNIKSVAKHMRTMHSISCEISRSLNHTERASAKPRRKSFCIQNGAETKSSPGGSPEDLKAQN